MQLSIDSLILSRCRYCLVSIPLLFSLNFSHASDSLKGPCSIVAVSSIGGVNLNTGIEFNEFKQLTSYPNKDLLARPIITNRSIVAFVFGQSNAGNSAGQRFSADGCSVINYWNHGYYLANDPLLGSTGQDGSPWVLTGNKLIRDGLADNVIVVPAAVGGTSVSQWRANGRLHQMLKGRLGEVAENGIEITHFLWHQGESDHPLAENSLGPIDYESGMLEIISLTKQYFPNSKFFVSIATRCTNKSPNLLLQNIQRKITSVNGVYLGPNTDNIGDEDRYDGCHFSGAGIEKHSDGWVSAIKSEAKADLNGSELQNF